MAKIPCEHSGEGIKTAPFSGTTDASGNITLTTDPSRVIIGAYDTGGNCYTFWKANKNQTLAKVYTTTNGYLAVKTNLAVSGTYIYIDNDSF
jgi:3',5'-cyclic AMP phosphodiesterase CpdA